MSVEEAVLELLKVHNRVIIPGFGAFLVAKDDTQDEGYVLFNSFLCFNDGLLVGYLVEKNGEDASIVTDEVEKYVAHVKATLAESQQYHFNSLGSFDIEESGAMLFKFNANEGKAVGKVSAPAKSSSKKADSKKEEVKKVEIKKVESKKVESASRTEAISEPAKVALKEEKVVKDDLLDFDSSVPPTVIIEQDNTISSKEAIDLSKGHFELVEEQSEKVAKASSPKKEEEKEVANIDGNNRKKRGVILWVAGLVIVALGLGYLFLIYLPGERAEEAQRLAMVEQAKHQAVLKQQTDSIAKVKMHELAIADSIRLADELALKTQNQPYHIIVGTFAGEENCDKLVSKVKAAGFPSACKIAGKKVFFVSAEACSDMNVANRRLSIVCNTLKMDCWIFKAK